MDPVQRERSNDSSFAFALSGYHGPDSYTVEGDGAGIDIDLIRPDLGGIEYPSRASQSSQSWRVIRSSTASTWLLDVIHWLRVGGAPRVRSLA